MSLVPALLMLACGAPAPLTQAWIDPDAPPPALVLSPPPDAPLEAVVEVREPALGARWSLDGTLRLSDGEGAAEVSVRSDSARGVRRSGGASGPLTTLVAHRWTPAGDAVRVEVVRLERTPAELPVRLALYRASRADRARLAARELVNDLGPVLGTALAFLAVIGTIGRTARRWLAQSPPG